MEAKWTPKAWMIIHRHADHTETQEVVLSPLTDETFMDEGDEAVPLYSEAPTLAALLGRMIEAGLGL